MPPPSRAQRRGQSSEHCPAQGCRCGSADPCSRPRGVLCSAWPPGASKRPGHRGVSNPRCPRSAPTPFEACDRRTTPFSTSIPRNSVFRSTELRNHPNNPPATFLCVEAHLQLGPQLGHLHQQLLRVDGGILRGTNSPRASGGQGWRILDPAKRARAQQRENGNLYAESHRVVFLEQSPLLHHGFPVCSLVPCWISRSAPSFSSPPRVEPPSFGLCFFASAKGPICHGRARLIIEWAHWAFQASNFDILGCRELPGKRQRDETTRWRGQPANCGGPVCHST